MDRDLGMYTRKEIKYRIDTAIQVEMFNALKEHKHDSDISDAVWRALLDVQSRLYEEFEIDEQKTN